MIKSTLPQLDFCFKEMHAFFTNSLKRTQVSSLRARSHALSLPLAYCNLTETNTDELGWNAEYILLRTLTVLLDENL